MQSSAQSVADYLKELPADRRAAISKVRAVIRKNLPKGYAEQMCYGMIGYVVPHKLYPAGYHCDPKLPLMYASLASQKNYMSFYGMALYMNADSEHGFASSSRREARNSIWARVVSASRRWKTCRWT